MSKDTGNNYPLLIAIFIFSFFSFWWVLIYLFGVSTDDIRSQALGSLYGLMALYGAIWGLHISSKWGGYKSKLGIATLFFSTGLFAQEIGQIAYSYYVYVLQIEIPYPSIGDLFFYGTIPLYVAGTVYLAKASGVRISRQSLVNKSQAIIIPLALLSLSYFFFLHEHEYDWSNPLTAFLDFVVPIGQAFYISIAILTYTLSRGMLGGMMKNRVLLILIALLAQYLADWTFLYQASRELYTPNGLADYLFLTAYFLMTLGLLQLNTVYSKLRDAKD